MSDLKAADLFSGLLISESKGLHACPNDGSDGVFGFARLCNHSASRSMAKGHVGIARNDL
jgi:hypothetical protein